MSNSKMIERCLMCEQDYCAECSDAKQWSQFCGKQCEREYGGSQKVEDKTFRFVQYEGVAGELRKEDQSKCE